MSRKKIKFNNLSILLLYSIFFLFMSFFFSNQAFAATYYVSNTGLDSNNGNSESTPWQTISKVNLATLVAGDSVLFKRGDSWFGQLIPKSGDSTAQITYGAYGIGEKPLLHESITENSTSDWTEESSHIWKTVYNYGSEKNTNISFDINTAGWSSYFNSSSGASGTLTRSITEHNSGSGSLELDVTTDAGSGYDIQLSMTNVSLEAGKTYELTFYAKATSSFLMPAIISSYPSYPFSTIVNPAQITTSWQKYTVYIPVIKTATGNISFSLGGFVLGGGIPNNTSFYLDDVSLKEFPTQKFLSVDVGNVIFNNEQSVGVKKWNKTDLSAQGQYWYDGTNSLYMYSTSNPASYYTDIKALISLNIIQLVSKNYVTIDGLALKYGGRNGVWLQNLNNIIIKNCDISWIGGGELVENIREGNGITTWINVSDILIENNKIWEIYDAGLSNQYTNNEGTTPSTQSNIIYRNNLVWNSEYSYEYFNRPSTGVTKNIIVENNIFNNAGYGWGHSQRPDPSGYILRLAGTPANTTNFVIRNNIFSEATGAIHRNYHTNNPQYTIDNNTITQSSGNVAFLAGSYYSDFGTYQSVSGWDTHSTFNSQPTIIPPSDTTPPTVSFSLPTTSNSLTVTITTLSATDVGGVTGYLLNETGTTPNAGSGSWSSTPQTSYTFTTTGSKTLYAFTKDASGNVSTSVSDTITITLPVVNNNTGGGGGGGSGGSYTPPTTTCPTGQTLINNICKSNTNPVILPITTIISFEGCGNRNTGFSIITGQSCIGNTITINPNPSNGQAYDFGTITLRNGSTGEAVKELQRFLNDKLNLGLVIDGKLGPKTIAVIKQWQKNNGLVPDGLVGKLTKAKMLE